MVSWRPALRADVVVDPTTDLTRASALVIVDVQNDYCHADGALARLGNDCTETTAVAYHVRALLQSARSAGLPVVHVRTEHSDWTDVPGWSARGTGGGGYIDPEGFPIARRGSWGAEPFGGIMPREDEWVVTKHRYSGFAYTSLELALRAKGCERVVLAGVTTDMCVRATAIDAVTRGFQPVLVIDGTACTDSARQASAIREFTGYCGPATTTEALVAAWSALAAPNSQPRAPVRA